MNFLTYQIDCVEAYHLDFAVWVALCGVAFLALLPRVPTIRIARNIYKHDRVTFQLLYFVKVIYTITLKNTLKTKILN